MILFNKMFLIWVLFAVKCGLVWGYDSRKYFVTCDSFGECDIPITFPESNVSTDTYSVIVNDDWINTTIMQPKSQLYLTQNIELTGDLPPRNIYMIYNIFNTLEKHFWRFNLTPLYLYSLRFGLSSIFIELRRPKTDDWDQTSIQKTLRQLMIESETSAWISKKLKRQLTFKGGEPIYIEEKQQTIISQEITIITPATITENDIDDLIMAFKQKLSDLYGIPIEKIEVYVIEEINRRRRLQASLTLEYTILVDEPSTQPIVLDQVNSLTGNDVVKIIAETIEIEIADIEVIPQIAEQSVVIIKEEIIMCHSKTDEWCVSANYDKIKSNKQCNNVCLPIECCEKNVISAAQLGNDTLALAQDSVAMGVGLRAHNDASFVIGHYNAIGPENNVFVVGNGVESQRSNALEVDFEGNVRISGSLRSNDISLRNVNDMLTSIESMIEECKCSVGIFNCDNVNALKRRFNKIMSKLDSC